MATKSGHCVLIIEGGRRFQEITFAVEWTGGPEAFGFLGGSVEIFRKAQTARKLELELDDGTTLPAKMLQVNHSGLALVSIDPRRLSQSRDTDR
jgi:hypothetical protein